MDIRFTHEATRTNFSNAFVSRFLKVIQRNIQEARSRQSAIYAITAAETSCGFISSCVPAIVLKLLLNQLSKRYSLCLTHVDGDLPVEGVDGAIYWRPPQGNCSRYIYFIIHATHLLYFIFFIASNCIHFFLDMSMTLHRLGNGVRLGIMADALIGPQHFIVARTFPQSIQNLASILGVPRTSSRSPSPNALNPMTSPGY